jgi:hypothetical protein
MDNETIHQTEQNEAQNERKKERADWITPAIVDYDLEELTRSSPPGPFAPDGTTNYS